MNLFCYGALMFEPVLSRIVRGNYQSARGTVQGFKRKRVKNETHPCALVSEKESLHGVVYFNVSSSDMKLLDAFEGSEYRRIGTVCRLVDGKEIEVEIYVWNQSPDLVSEEDWDVSWFETVGIHQFLSRYKGFKD